MLPILEFLVIVRSKLLVTQEKHSVTGYWYLRGISPERLHKDHGGWYSRLSNFANQLGNQLVVFQPLKYLKQLQCEIYTCTHMQIKYFKNHSLDKWNKALEREWGWSKLARRKVHKVPGHRCHDLMYVKYNRWVSFQGWWKRCQGKRINLMH